MQQTFRYAFFYEYSIRSLPVIIKDKDGNENKYLNLSNVSGSTGISVCKLKSYIDSGETFDVYDTSVDDYKQYTVRFAYDINPPEYKQMPLKRIRS